MKYEAYTDSTYEDCINKGCSAYVVRNKGNTIYKSYKMYDMTDSTYGESLAIRNALQFMYDNIYVHSVNAKFILCSDSQGLVNKYQKVQKLLIANGGDVISIKKDNCLGEETLTYLNKLKYVLELEWVRREHNEEADALARYGHEKEVVELMDVKALLIHDLVHTRDKWVRRFSENDNTKIGVDKLNGIIEEMENLR